MELFKNLTVLSLEQATVAPYLTYRLAQDGMNVVRLEHPKYGDPNRFIGENVLDEKKMNSYFLCINSGKKALSLNMADPKGQEIFKQLIRKLEVDIFVTNQLPKNYEKLGIAYELMKEVKPDIIWLGLTGFGPDSNEGAYDPILQARSGLMELTGEANGDPQVLGIPLPDMGTSEHGYGLLMKALFKRAMTGKGTRIDLSMFESTVSWLTVPIALSKSFGANISRRGNTHEFFSPVSVYKTSNGFVYLAVGNDRQWEAMVSQDMFKSLARDEYKKNQGRIADVKNLNAAINAITKEHTSEELIEMFNAITVPISKIKNVNEVVEDPLVARRILTSTDPKTGTKVTLAPPPNMTPFLEETDRKLSFPPRFGEQNGQIYGDILGYDKDDLAEFKEKGII
ncbi:MAG: CoA transferase [Desulfobacula sp.]|uniref:CaiB/BaiF CoA transferase family protein n=1 Tax=Desulfobacula sp. TaxID=2593537 RepID=UPI001DC54727|nr:CoA transferase [Desulfobacula sp.]MBT3486671.1 CoA transferase [Desulfobacula sp.]MBT3804885.1 CoA transferase [Desulfobacula sp.]MBT4026664.1 CoA transferase [Desulfobacula sp.]MBT4200486.1 CoA transferase [Desulfobacula sp.]